MKKIPKKTISSALFLFLYGFFLVVSSKPIYGIDSPRYFVGYMNSETVFDELVNHSGRNVQTLLFSFFQTFSESRSHAAMFANLFIWWITAVGLIYFLEKNILSNLKQIILTVFILGVYTSNLIASWIPVALSESIAISFLVPLLVVSLMVFLREIHPLRSRNLMTILLVLLFCSQPIWGFLIGPIVLIAQLGHLKKSPRQILIIGAIGLISLVISTISHRLPYENTGLTFKGFESLTRALTFSKPDRFGEVAFGSSLVECQKAYDLLKDSQSTGDTWPLFTGFKSASENCPDVVEEFNSGKSNSILTLLTNDLGRSTIMIAHGLYAIINQQVYLSETLSIKTFGLLSSDLISPIGIFLLPIIFFISGDKREKILLGVVTLTTTVGGLLLYLQVGIEGERHSLPAALILSLLAWTIIAIRVCDKFEAKFSKHKEIR